MAELLLELMSEEIPAHMQGAAARELRQLLEGDLGVAGLQFDAIETHAGPRRLTAVVTGLPSKGADRVVERKGPRLGAPARALEGFCRSAGLAGVEEARVVEDKNGAFYLAVSRIPGRATADLLREILPETLPRLTWPKSMRWGEGRFRWIRPLRRLLCLFDGGVVPFELAGLVAGDGTQGHRVMGAGPFVVADFDDYEKRLHQCGHVVLRAAERRRLVAEGSAELCRQAGFELVPDEPLLEELSGLAEWPVPLLGRMDPAFLALPEIVILEAMRQHQKYLGARRRDGKLAPAFVVVADLLASDGGAAIVAGNERVLAARLSDARFFWERDVGERLADRRSRLSGLMFLRPRGAGDPLDMAAKTDRVEQLAGLLAPLFAPEGCEVASFAGQAARAARLSKCDLVTQTVVEFPRLQGRIGRLLALRDGEDSAVAEAIADHYRPAGGTDALPEAPVSACVAFADRLVAFALLWAAGERVSGGGDPFGLRRLALGIARLAPPGVAAGSQHHLGLPDLMARSIADSGIGETSSALEGAAGFVVERYKTWRAGRRHPIRRDFLDAAWFEDDDFRRNERRAAALQGFFLSPETAGACDDLVAGYRRAVNILAKEKFRGSGAVLAAPVAEAEERALHEEVRAAERAIDACLPRDGRPDDAAALSALTRLRQPLDAFFEAVRVNVEDDALRQRRLALLAAVREQSRRVADFSKVRLEAREQGGCPTTQ